MSNSMGIASLFVVSSLLLSPLAMAEESPVFAAHNRAVMTQLDNAMAQSAERQDGAQQTASKAPASDNADS